MFCPDCEPSPWWHVFDTTAYAPRGSCGDWPDFMIAAWVVPSLMIFAIYMAVAVAKTLAFVRMKGTTYPRWASLSIAAFFVGCAGGHLMNAVAFWWPAYRAFVLWDWFTLAASAVGFFAVRRIIGWQVREYDATRRAERLAAETADVLAAERLKAERYRIALVQAETQLTLRTPVGGAA